MSDSCSALDCQEEEVELFSFPLNDDQLKELLEAMENKDFEPTVFDRLCSEDCSSGCFEVDSAINGQHLRKSEVSNIFNENSVHLQEKLVKQNKGPYSHLVNGSGKLDEKPDRDGVIDPEAEVQYFLQDCLTSDSQECENQLSSNVGEGSNCNNDEIIYNFDADGKLILWDHDGCDHNDFCPVSSGEERTAINSSCSSSNNNNNKNNNNNNNKNNNKSGEVTYRLETVAKLVPWDKGDSSDTNSFMLSLSEENNINGGSIYNVETDPKLVPWKEIGGDGQTPRGAYCCCLCSKRFASKYYLKLHYRSHRGEKFECAICGKEVTTKTSLAQHMRTHTGEKPYKCAVCARSFAISQRLKEHERTHTGERPFECFQCKKCFTQSGTLAQHLRTHTGQRPYPCRLCDKRFGAKTTLERHVRSHCGEKPFGCDECGRQFSSKQRLVYHLKTHADGAQGAGL